MDHNKENKNVLKEANRIMGHLVRLETHASFFAQCLDLDIIPKGLRLNFKNAFDIAIEDVSLTNNILNQTSKRLMYHIIQ